MGVFRALSSVIMRQVLSDQAESVLGLLGDRFSDNARRLERALGRAAERSWRALEVALAGPSLWQSMCDLLGSRDDRTLRRQVQAFLDYVPGLPGPFRLECLKELRSARRVKLVPGPTPGAFEVAGDLAAFSRYSDPLAALEQEQRAIAGVASALRREGYPMLARYVELRPAGGQTLLTWSAQFFFRREVEEDPRLSAALTLDTLEGAKGDLQRFQEMVESRLASQAEELRRVTALLHEMAERQKPPEPPPPGEGRKRLISELFSRGE